MSREKVKKVSDDAYFLIDVEDMRSHIVFYDPAIANQNITFTEDSDEPEVAPEDQAGTNP